MSTIKKIKYRASGLVIGAFPIMIFLAGCGDVINVANGSGQPVGLMVDGQDSSGPFNDRGFISAASAIGVGELSSSPQSNEVTGFTNDRPPKYLSTPWTSDSDAFNLGFRPVTGIPVTVWIVKGPFADQRQHAIEACIRTSARARSRPPGGWADDGEHTGADHRTEADHDGIEGVELARQPGGFGDFIFSLRGYSGGAPDSFPSVCQPRR